MKALYLLTTEHLENLLWFREGEDFKVAMNYVAIQAAETPDVAVFAFILMSNHVHFLLKGHRERTTDFVQGFKHRYSLYYSRKYGIKEFLRKNGLDVKLIPYEDEAPEKAVAYIQMNSVAANICAHPSQYSWGTGNTFFNPAPTGGKRLSSLSGRARKRMLHSEADHRLPPDWQICESGYIPPGYYVDVTAVEALFRSPRRMNFFLVNSSNSRTFAGACSRRPAPMNCLRRKRPNSSARSDSVSAPMPTRSPAYATSPMLRPPDCWTACKKPVQ